jgi:excisionase family DNA binding protein
MSGHFAFAKVCDDENMNATELPNDLVTPTEAGKLIGVTSKTIRNWIDTGKLAGFRVGGRRRVSRECVIGMVKPDGPKGKPLVITKAEARKKAKHIEEVLYGKRQG